MPLDITLLAIIMMIVIIIISIFAGLIEDCNRCQYPALVGLNDVTIHHHLIQDHVSTVNVEHDLLHSTARVKGRYIYSQTNSSTCDFFSLKTVFTYTHYLE